VDGETPIASASSVVVHPSATARRIAARVAPRRSASVPYEDGSFVPKAASVAAG
jgi:hypothetical protein